MCRIEGPQRWEKELGDMDRHRKWKRVRRYVCCGEKNCKENGGRGGANESSNMVVKTGTRKGHNVVGPNVVLGIGEKESKRVPGPQTDDQKE